MERRALLPDAGRCRSDRGDSSRRCRRTAPQSDASPCPSRVRRIRCWSSRWCAPRWKKISAAPATSPARSDGPVRSARDRAPRRAQARHHRRADRGRMRLPAGRSGHVVPCRGARRHDRRRPAQCSPPSKGPRARLLTAERVALNFVGHLSGVATATRALVDAVAGTKARIVCTRKTTPGLRDPAEICRALRRRLQSPFRPGRRRADQGQPSGGRRRHRTGGRARPRRHRPYGQDRSGSGHAGPARRGAGAGR